MEVVNFNDYREVTMNGFKEIIQLNEESKRTTENAVRTEINNLMVKLNDDFSKIQTKLKQHDNLFNEH